MQRLMHKIAIVTGVSRENGIGTAICRALAGEGADVFFTHWSQYDRQMEYIGGDDVDWPQRLTQELRNGGVRCEAMALDLSNPDAPLRLLTEVQERLGLPSILVNNATHSVNADFQSLNAAVLDSHYAVNVRGTLLLTVEFARQIKGKHTGHIVNMVSGQDKQPEPGNLAYVSTKGAVSAFTKSIALELAPHRITINAVDPGPTDTGWMNEELKAYLLPRFPMGRIGEPRDAGNLILFLASDESAWVTGQIIHSDGGFWNMG